MPYVLLVNEMDKPFADKCGGKDYVIPPGKAAKVPDYVAYHFIGDPRILNGQDGIEAEAERIRVYQRYGAFTPDARAIKLPKLRIEAYEEEEAMIVDVKKPKKAVKQEEPEFPSLVASS